MSRRNVLFILGLLKWLCFRLGGIWSAVSGASELRMPNAVVVTPKTLLSWLLVLRAFDSS
jgi:hypothetical protein